MKQKIKKIVAVALLSMVVLGMTAPALSASAATGSVNDGCEHTNLEIKNSELLGYPNVTSLTHQAKYRRTYKCTDCLYTFTVIETPTEPHRQASSGSLYCVCGYYLR